MKRVAIITSSDMGYQGKREDLSGPAIKEIAEREGYQVVSMDILPDDRAMLSRRMAEIADENQAELILTTGGTGFSPRDIMPEATEEMAVQLEDILKELPPVTTMIKEGMTAEDILFRVTEGFSMVCENKAVVPEYKCTCSKERMEKALISIGKKELEELIEDQGEAELTCQFCDNKYHFNKQELEDLLEKAK